MLRKRIEKLEVALPLSAGKLMERLDRQALNALSIHDRELCPEMLRSTDRRRKVWSPEYRTAEARHLEAFGLLLQEVSDDELASLIEQVERQLGRPIPKLEAIQ